MTMPKPWQEGYDWGANLDADPLDDVLDALGYDFDTPEHDQFLAGVEQAQAEFGIGDIAGDAWAESDEYLAEGAR